MVGIDERCVHQTLNSPSPIYLQIVLQLMCSDALNMLKTQLKVKYCCGTHHISICLQ